MDRYRKGMLVRSKAGHDTGKVYIIVESADEEKEVQTFADH